MRQCCDTAAYFLYKPPKNQGFKKNPEKVLTSLEIHVIIEIIEV